MQAKPRTRQNNRSIPLRKAKDQIADTHLTVRFLATSTGTATTELLGLRSSGVGDQKSAVVGDKELTELKGRGSIVVLGVVGNERLGDSLADGVDLRGVTTTGDTETDVDSAVTLKVRRERRGKSVSCLDLWVREVIQSKRTAAATPSMLSLHRAIPSCSCRYIMTNCEIDPFHSSTMLADPRASLLYHDIVYLI